jgi:hypothetical protein
MLLVGFCEPLNICIEGIEDSEEVRQLQGFRMTRYLL